MLRDNAIYSSLSDAFNAFQERRKQFGLSNPGTIETVARGALLSPYIQLLKIPGAVGGECAETTYRHAAALHDAAAADFVGVMDNHC